VSRRCDAPSRGIEIERIDKLQFDLLVGLQRLMRVGKRHQHLASIFEVHMILIAEVFDATHAADDAAAVGRRDLQVLGSDADRVGAGRHHNLGNKARGKEINLRRAEAARHVAAVGILVNLPFEQERRQQRLPDLDSMP